MKDPLPNNAIDLNHTQENIMSIRLWSDGFSFSLRNPHTGTPIEWYREESIDPASPLTYQQQLERAIGHYDLLQQNFKQIYIVVHSNHFMVIPAQYSDSEANDCFQHFVGSQLPETVVANRLPQVEIQNLFGLDVELHLFLTQRYPHCTLLHHLSPLGNYLCIKGHGVANKRLYALLHKGDLEVICENEGELLLANTFSYNSTDDAAYYLLNIWQKLELNPYLDSIIVGGEPSERNELSQRLKTYIVEVMPFDLDTVYSGERVPHDLIILQRCEL